MATYGHVMPVAEERFEPHQNYLPADHVPPSPFIHCIHQPPMKWNLEMCAGVRNIG